MDKDYKRLTEIGTRIKAERIRLRLNQKELAIKAETSAQSVSEAERGMRELGALTIIRIAKALEVSADYLLSGEYGNYTLPFHHIGLNILNAEQRKKLEEVNKIFFSLCEKSPDLNN
jgi:transcriptional regulator with XRE-family HTH domain